MELISAAGLLSSTGFMSGTAGGAGERTDGFFPGRKADRSRSFVMLEMLVFYSYLK